MLFHFPGVWTHFLYSQLRADPVCLDVCRGDALLKKMLREGIRMEKEAAFDAMMNPRLAVSISRVSDKKGMFSQNAVKTVTHKNNHSEVSRYKQSRGKILLHQPANIKEISKKAK
ncbi:hypothetical protein JTB14_013050 [Gonioctena quinquepunctata]|nr:hypothetical protein JTB14_013050 [Gonioctena quinquepunctata]